MGAGRNAARDVQMTDQLSLFDRQESQRHAVEGVTLAVENNAVRVVKAREIAKEVWKRLRRPISADDVVMEMVKRKINANIGNAMGGLFRTTDWRWTGEFVKSARVRSHANLLRTWVYVGK